MPPASFQPTVTPTCRHYAPAVNQPQNPAQGNRFVQKNADPSAPKKIEENTQGAAAVLQCSPLPKPASLKNLPALVTGARFSMFLCNLHLTHHSCNPPNHSISNTRQHNDQVFVITQQSAELAGIQCLLLEGLRLFLGLSEAVCSQWMSQTIQCRSVCCRSAQLQTTMPNCRPRCSAVRGPRVLPANFHSSDPLRHPPGPNRTTIPRVTCRLGSHNPLPDTCRLGSLHATARRRKNS